jgi:short-subunit dehydrogenase
VLTVKPGFVDTPMTRGIVDPRLPLLATPERVAADIYRALVKGRSVLYTPRYWQGIMACIRAIPEPLFKRMSV